MTLVLGFKPVPSSTKRGLSASFPIADKVLQRLLPRLAGQPQVAHDAERARALEHRHLREAEVVEEGAARAGGA